MNIYFRFPDFRLKAFTMSYDDGRQFDRQMIEIMNRYGVRGTFNLNSRNLDGSIFVTSGELAKTYQGHEVASHTFSHPYLPEITRADFINELMEDRKILERAVGKIVDGFAYPFGLKEINNEPETVALCGLKYARTTVATGDFDLPNDFLRWHPTCHHTDTRLMTLVDRFLQPAVTSPIWEARPKLFYVWGHSYEFDQNHNWELLEELCAKVGGKEDTWYATNGEICDYIKAYNSLRKSVDGTVIYNPSAIPVYACINGKDVLLEPGKQWTL